MPSTESIMLSDRFRYTRLYSPARLGGTDTSRLEERSRWVSEVRYGTEVDFLQDVLRVEGPAAQVEEDENATTTEREGQAYSLGQVKKKMVLIPDWAKLYS